jgi:hypothetical protein
MNDDDKHTKQKKEQHILKCCLFIYNTASIK